MRIILRRLARTPGFAISAIAMLGIAIGAVASVSGVVYQALVRDLPFRQSHRLVLLTRDSGDGIVPYHAPADLRDFSEYCQAFEMLAGVGLRRVVLNGGSEADQVIAASVSPTFFEMMGVPAEWGRTLEANEEPRANFVVLSNRIWRSRFAANRDLIGKIVELDDSTMVVAGVMPPSFQFLNVDLWLGGDQGVPLPPRPIEGDLLSRRDLAYFRIVGRLADGWSIDQARSEVAATGAQVAQQAPDIYQDTRFDLLPLKQVFVRSYRHNLELLGWAVACVLLIAWANLAGLLVARAAGRGRELAIRQALGAGRSTVARALIGESLVVASAGGFLGILLAVWGARGVRALAKVPQPDGTPGAGLAVLTVAFLVSLVVGVLAGTLPAMRMIRSGQRSMLSDQLAAAGSGRSRSWSVLVAVAVGLSFLLSLGTILLVATLVRLEAVELGVDSRDLLLVTIQLPRFRYPDSPSRKAFHEEVGERIEALPAVVASSWSLIPPLSSDRVGLGFRIGAAPVNPDERGPTANFSLASPGYFKTLRVPILAGREFLESDGAGAALVAVVNEAMAKKYWGQESPIGAELYFRENQAVTVVGVVGNVRQRNLLAPEEPMVLRPFAQSPWPSMTFVVRFRPRVAGLRKSIREVVREVDPRQPIAAIQTMDERLDEILGARRRVGRTLVGFSVAALLLAAVGVYGIVAFRLRSIRKEIAIRLALGASRGALLRWCLRRGLLPVIVGSLLGMIGAGLALKWVKSELFGAVVPGPTAWLLAFSAVFLAGVAGVVLATLQGLHVEPLESIKTD